MRETNGLRHYRTIARSATMLACAGAAGLLWACSDDTTTAGEDAGNDVSVTDSSPPDAAKDSPAADSTAMDASTSDAKDSTTPDSTVTDAPSNDAPADAPKEAEPADAHADAPADSSPGDSSTTSDAAADAADAGSSGDMLALCPFLDTNAFDDQDGGQCVNFTDPNNASCPDRIGTWSSEFTNDFELSLPMTMSDGTMQPDCRIYNSVFAPIFGNQTLIQDYSNQLLAFNVDLFGCPAVGSDAGVTGGYGLIPGPLVNHVFTSADTDLLSSLYLQSVENDIINNGGTDPLTQGQIDAITAELARRAATLPGYHVSTAYSDPSACAADAGSDSPSSDASDAGAGD